MSVFRHPQATPGRNYQQPEMSMRMPKPPERPLQPYMRYSRKMWPKVRAENPDVQLWDIGKIVGKMWADLGDAEKSMFQHEYEMERMDYEKQMKHFQNSGYSSFMSSKGRAKQNEKMSRGRMDAGGVVIQPVDEEDGSNEMTTRRMAGVRFDRNHRLIADLFSPTMVTDTRTIVAQHRMDMLKRQATSLAQHQSKLEEELVKLQTTHTTRKRAIEKGSDEFQEELKKVVDEKPVVDEEKFEETVKEWEEKLKEAYEEYKKKLEEMTAKAAATAPVLRNLVMDEPAKKDETENTPAENNGEKPAESETTTEKQEENGEEVEDEEMAQEEEEEDEPKE
ncbi:unnamed protein product [Caenorhabditis angaria]|uniref:HMG box domain-containing protein n=1 Tax=Caenorhabditis angaria TaxID=860376 RepID=A0A9P1MYC8_9PELO|nr:unnamed protein product [Caenorhabditis angaria]